MPLFQSEFQHEVEFCVPLQHYLSITAVDRLAAPPPSPILLVNLFALTASPEVFHCRIGNVREERLCAHQSEVSS